MKDKLPINEILMFEQFYDYIDNVLKKERKSSAKFYHWSGAEPIAYTRFKQRNPIVNFRDNNWQFYDLYQVFLSEPIVVKGALNFSLKTIAKALKSHNLIESSWDQYSPCANGLSAMILANKLYESLAYRNENEDITLDTTMKEIMNYNEIDCKVMYEIHDLIKNH
jgi:predicted RecB family nuclease